MTDRQATGRPWHLWVVGVASALWNCGGAFDYTMTKTRSEEYLAQFTAEQIAFFNSFPLWANIVWALGVWGALAGSILLLFASRWAVHAFAVSLFGLAGGTVFQFVASDMPASLKTPVTMGFTALLWVVAVLLLWYAIRMRARGVLR